jgi:HSP20 family protein
MAAANEQQTSLDPDQPEQGKTSQSLTPERGGEARMAARGERPWPARGAGPFSLMRRFNDEVDRLFDGFFSIGGWDDRWPFARHPARGAGAETAWPALDVYQRDGKLVIQLDAPGLKKEDVKVELKDDALVISGERRRESEREEGGVYRTERSYGRFFRTVPLPEGAKGETASATFDAGVLRIEIDAPTQQSNRSRQIEVREGPAH